MRGVKMGIRPNRVQDCGNGQHKQLGRTQNCIDSCKKKLNAGPCEIR